MWAKNIKRDPADVAFSKYVRLSQGYTCQRCLKKFPDNAANLHNSHFFGRRKESTRYDLQNCDAICSYCHRHFESNPAEYVAFKLKQLGQKDYDSLVLRANSFKKKDRKMDCLIWKQALKDLKEEK